MTSAYFEHHKHFSSFDPFEVSLICEKEVTLGKIAASLFSFMFVGIDKRVVEPLVARIFDTCPCILCGPHHSPIISWVSRLWRLLLRHVPPLWDYYTIAFIIVNIGGFDALHTLCMN